MPLTPGEIAEKRAELLKFKAELGAFLEFFRATGFAESARCLELARPFVNGAIQNFNPTDEQLALGKLATEP